MVRENLKAFLEKSGLPLSYVARMTKICRTQLSYFIHGHRDISFEQQKKVKKFIEDYINRWKE